MGEEKRAVLAELLAGVDAEIARYRRLADKHMRISYALRSAVLVLSPLVPLAAGFGSEVAAGILGAAVAIAAGFEALLRSGEKWRVFRSAEIMLQSARHAFRRETLDEDPEAEGYRAAVGRYLDRTQEIMRQEMSEFWRLQAKDTARDDAVAPR
jgi:hypothetical protein